MEFSGMMTVLFILNVVCGYERLDWTVVCSRMPMLPQNQLEYIKDGFGIIVQNVGQTDIFLSAHVSFHERQYPCTLSDCCAESKSS